MFFTPASGLAAYAGAVVVGAEGTAATWVVRPAGSGFEAVPATTDLPAVPYNLEGATYVP